MHSRSLSKMMNPFEVRGRADSLLGCDPDHFVKLGGEGPVLQRERPEGGANPRHLCGWSQGQTRGPDDTGEYGAQKLTAFRPTIWQVLQENHIY